MGFTEIFLSHMEPVKKNIFLKIIFLIINFMAISFISCRNHPLDKLPDESVISNQLTKMNRKIVLDESKEINEFIARHFFKMEMTGSGLRYSIYNHGSGNHPQNQNSVEVSYKVYLLDGTLCYSTDTTGHVKFKLGIGSQIKGLEEGVLLMVPGDKARLLIPAHLAYGMSGDNNKIPPSSALYFDVELLKVQP